MSQNNKNLDELNMMNITDDSLGLSDEMINAYMEASALETPDLWARVEAGFEQEIKSLNEEKTVVINNASAYPPEQLVAPQQMAQVQSMPAQPQNVQYQQAPQQPQQDNVIDFQKRAARKKMIRNLAAIVILCVIAVPVMHMVSKNGDKHKSDDKYSETTAASAPECDAYDAEESYDVKDEATGNSEIQNFAPSADETPSADDTTAGVSMMLTVDVTGTFVFEDDQLLFVIDESEGEVFESIQGGTVIVLIDSEEVAATYFEKVDGTDSYGPYSVSIDIDTETMNDERPTGILLPNSSLKK